MKTKFALKLAASAFVLGGTLIAAFPAGFLSGVASAVDSGQGDRIAAAAAAKAQKALKAKDSVKAILQAEMAVEAAPRDAGYRALLGQSYLQGGRLVSAEAAFYDAITLAPGDTRSTLSLALVQIALGQPELGLQTLNAAGGPISDADRGLALALAGDTQGAIRLLEGAAREEGASAKVRQNLALSYALAGQWSQARAIAAQDVPADQLDRRMASWAGFSNPHNSWDQVATLLAIKPVLDRGQPQRLALAPMPAPEVQTAAAEPAPEAAPEPEPELTAAMAEAPAPAMLAATAEPAPGAMLRQVVFAPRREVIQTLPASFVGAARPHYVAAVTPAAPRGSGKYVVQLGAYSSAAKAESAWGRAVGRFGLTAYAPNGTTLRMGKATYHRVSAGGFATRQDAARVCAAVKAKGGACFVRMATPDAPALWTQRAMSTRLAARSS